MARLYPSDCGWSNLAIESRQQLVLKWQAFMKLNAGSLERSACVEGALPTPVSSEILDSEMQKAHLMHERLSVVAYGTQSISLCVMVQEYILDLDAAGRLHLTCCCHQRPPRSHPSL